MVKNPLAMQETQEMQVQSLSQEDPWSRKWQPTPVSWLGKCHGQKSLEGYSPEDCKDSDTTEANELTYLLFHVVLVSAV